MKRNPLIKSEEGTVLVIALIILVFLTLIGISITVTTEVEIQIAGNERLYKNNLYTAEAAAMQCAQEMEEEPNLDPLALTYLHALGSLDKYDHILNDGWWDTNSDPATQVDPDARFLAVEEGVAEGTTLDMTKTTLRSYTIYGRKFNAARPNLGRSIIRVGYRRAE